MKRGEADLLSDNNELLAAYGQWLARSRGGRVEQWNDVVLCDGGFASPYRNMVVPIGPLDRQQARDLRAKIEDFYGSHVGWVLWSSHGEDLSDCGYTAMGKECLLMIRAERPVPPSETRAPLVIHECRTDDDMQAFEHIRESANGRHFDREVDGFLDRRTLGNGLRAWLGLIEGTPVAAGSSFRRDDKNLIKNVATLPQAQGLGIAAAMSARAVSAGGRCFLDSSNPPAIHLYRKLGFSEFGRLRTWGP